MSTGDSLMLINFLSTLVKQHERLSSDDASAGGHYEPMKVKVIVDNPTLHSSKNTPFPSGLSKCSLRPKSLKASSPVSNARRYRFPNSEEGDVDPKISRIIGNRSRSLTIDGSRSGDSPKESLCASSTSCEESTCNTTKIVWTAATAAAAADHCKSRWSSSSCCLSDVASTSREWSYVDDFNMPLPPLPPHPAKRKISADKDKLSCLPCSSSKTINHNDYSTSSHPETERDVIELVDQALQTMKVPLPKSV